LERRVLDGFGAGIVAGEFLDKILDDYFYFLLLNNFFQLRSIVPVLFALLALNVLVESQSAGLVELLRFA
jgi:hypothetical protein